LLLIHYLFKAIFPLDLKIPNVEGNGKARGIKTYRAWRWRLMQTEYTEDFPGTGSKVLREWALDAL